MYKSNNVKYKIDKIEVEYFEDGGVLFLNEKAQFYALDEVAAEIIEYINKIDNVFTVDNIVEHINEIYQNIDVETIRNDISNFVKTLKEKEIIYEV